MNVANEHHPSAPTLRLAANVAADVARAAAILRDGGLVAMPTETVYGLATNALDAAAVERIFVAKQRPHWDPLIVHVADKAMLSHVVRAISEEAQRLMDAFWPGPLTLLLPRHLGVPEAVTAGRDLVGVRMPAHAASLALIQAAGVPLAAPSANRFGHISPTTAEHVLADLDCRIDAVVDAGPCAIGVESTVFDPAARVLYRQGGVSCAQLEATLGARVEVYQRREDTTRAAAAPESLPSPGVGIRHYAPAAKVRLVHSEADLQELLGEMDAATTGVLLPKGWVTPRPVRNCVAWEDWDDAAALARTLYTGLRSLDALGVDTIVCPLPRAGDEPLIEALRDRLLKAARD